MSEPSQPHDPTDLLNEVLRSRPGGFVELRYHRRRRRRLRAEDGKLVAAETLERAGVAARVLEQGFQGFACATGFEREGILAALESARRAANAARAAASPGAPLAGALPACRLARGRFEGAGVREALERPLAACAELVLASAAAARAASPKVQSAVAIYLESLEEKAIVSSDGARVWTSVARPELHVVAVARAEGELTRNGEALGASGGWSALFRHESAAELAERAGRHAVELLRAGYPESGKQRVLLSPALVGLLAHEAIGHTVEADFVAAGSCARDRLGTQVASELVTLCDSGHSELEEGAAGSIAVDDEGVPAERTVLIERGRLVGYLHDRRSAALHGVPPSGNARAWEHDKEPLIRMRNTYVEPGEQSFEELLEGLGEGYLFDGRRNGQADTNGEFVFGTGRARRVQGGKLGPWLRGVNIAGSAFEVLSSVSGLGRDFRWALGAGHCGKGQPAKVDAGGPWLACEVLVGGRRT